MVAGDHLDADASILAVAHGGNGFLARRVADADQAQQRKTAFHVGELQFVLVVIDGLHRQCQHALSECAGRRHLRVPVWQVDCRVIADDALPVAHRQHLFHRALHKDEGVPGVVVVQRCHETVFGLERDMVGARQFAVLKGRVHAGLQCQRDQRPFGRVAGDVPVPVVFL